MPFGVDLKEFVSNCRRVLRIARKPNREEFITTSKVCAIGLALIGFIGFVIFILFILTGI